MFDKERKLKNNYRTVVFTVPKDLIWPSNKPFLSIGTTPTVEPVNT